MNKKSVVEIVRVKPGQRLAIVLDENQIFGFLGVNEDDVKSEWVITIKAECSLVNPDNCNCPITSDFHVKGCKYYAPTPAEIYQESLL